MYTRIKRNRFVYALYVYPTTYSTPYLLKYRSTPTVYVYRIAGSIAQGYLATDWVTLYNQGAFPKPFPSSEILRRLTGPYYSSICSDPFDRPLGRVQLRFLSMDKLQAYMWIDMPCVLPIVLLDSDSVVRLITVSMETSSQIRRSNGSFSGVVLACA